MSCAPTTESLVRDDTAEPRVRPLVTVVIPSYDHSEFVAEAVHSVVAQTYRPLELIVVDDGSTDGSPGLLRDLLERIPLTRVSFLQQANRGAHDAMNRGVRASSGEIVAVLNSDDLHHPRRLELLVPLLLAGDRCSLAFSRVGFIDREGRCLEDAHAWPRWYFRSLEEAFEAPTLGFGLLRGNFSVSSGNLVFRRSLFDRLGGFAEHRFAHDWDFLLRSLVYTEPAFVSETLLSYRIHDANTTETVRHLLDAEGRDVLRRYRALLEEEEPTPNPLAPAPANWPRYFRRFAASCPLPFAPEETLDRLWSDE